MTSGTKLKFSLWLCLGAGIVSSMSAQNVKIGETYISEEDFYSEDLIQTVDVSDPLEPLNRLTFKFNDVVYMWVLKPVAKGYTTVAPAPVRKGLGNFLENLKYPVRLTGNLLQGRLNGAFVETGRFAVNTTVGIAGIMRPADSIECLAPIPPEDVGQAFGAWGVGEGPYLILPVLGPSNLRDLGGYLGDRVVNPLQVPYSLIDHWSWEHRLAGAAVELTVASPAIVKRYSDLKGQAFDPYSSMKNGYTQLRRGQINDRPDSAEAE